MSDWPDAEQTLARFREWLEQIRAEAEAIGGDTAPAGDSPKGTVPFSSNENRDSPPPVDSPVLSLVDLVREFTALRHEVKLQTKSARNLEEQTAAAVEALGAAARQFESVEPRETEAAERAAAPLVETLADLDEALQRGQEVMEGARRRILDQSAAQFHRELEDLYARQPAWKRWLCRGWHKAIGELERRMAQTNRQILDSLVEGYGLARGRLQRAMAREGLRRMACIGRPVDPHTMTVVEAVEDPGQAPGTVVDEIRPGYLWNSRVLRFAEVRAVRQPEPPGPVERQLGGLL